MFASSSNVRVYATSLVRVNEPLGNICGTGALAGAAARAGAIGTSKIAQHTTVRVNRLDIAGNSSLLPTGAQKIACAADKSNPLEGGTLHVSQDESQDDPFGAVRHAGIDDAERLSWRRRRERRWRVSVEGEPVAPAGGDRAQR